MMTALLLPSSSTRALASSGSRTGIGRLVGRDVHGGDARPERGRRLGKGACQQNETP